ncbi:thioredoxin domain-containing protein [Candidatus Micrarchaeota archaeon]|nr:thioredoxin domain-containing protein [Candidatus Micrarchaeota archaeon]
MAESKHSKKSADSSPSGLPPLHIGIGIVALLLIVGVAYVFMTQAPAVKPTPTPIPSASVPAITPGPDGNFSLPKQAELTGQASCANGSVVPVLLFTDPYCPACVQTEPQVNAFYDEYAQKTDVQYRFVSTHSRSLSPRYGIDVVYQAHDYMVCAQEQHKIQEFKKCFYQTLPFRDGDFIPLNVTQLDACAVESGVDKPRLDACLPGARAKVDASIAEAARFGGGSFFTPMAVVGCQYRVNSVLAEKTYCALSQTC